MSGVWALGKVGVDAGESSWSKHWGIAGESKRQVNTGKCKRSQVLFSVVNRRPDDECQRACGVYRSVAEGQQLQVIKTQVTGIW